MELLPDDEFYARLNTVNLAAGALIRNENDQVLIVNPSYREHWLIPGGSVDRDESPGEACRREIREEIGLELPLLGVLSVEYLPRRDYRPEAIHFIFDGGILDESQIAKICLCDKELLEFEFCCIEVACGKLNASLAGRYRAAWDCLDRGSTAYLERGVVQ